MLARAAGRAECAQRLIHVHTHTHTHTHTCATPCTRHTCSTLDCDTHSLFFPMNLCQWRGARTCGVCVVSACVRAHVCVCACERPRRALAGACRARAAPQARRGRARRRLYRGPPAVSPHREPQTRTCSNAQGPARSAVLTNTRRPVPSSHAHNTRAARGGPRGSLRSISARAQYCSCRYKNSSSFLLSSHAPVCQKSTASGTTRRSARLRAPPSRAAQPLTTRVAARRARSSDASAAAACGAHSHSCAPTPASASREAS